jgi:hypothetical protein
VFVFCFEEGGMERERDVERKLKKRVESTGGWCLKFLSSISGVPDRICLFPGGKLVFVELKRHGAKPRPLQRRQIEKIRQLGFRVEVIDSEEGIEGLIHSIEDGKKEGEARN